MDLLNRFNTNPVFIRPEYAEIAALSRPAYRNRESGVCLVVGTHPCSDRDVDAALAKYPNAKVCAVNEATALLPADHLASCHGENLERFIDAHERTWGDADYELPTIHIKDNADTKTDRPCYRWQTTIGAGSAPFAACVMQAIGFDLIIFCGCPMDGGGGYAIETHASTMNDPRFGFLAPDHNMVRTWHDALYAFKEQQPDIAAKFRSMSGFTKEVFGGIE